MKHEALGVLKIPVEKLGHRCATVGCDHPSRDGKPRSRCAKCKAEQTAFRDTGRRDEFEESVKNQNGQHKIDWNEELTHFSFTVKDKRLREREDQNKSHPTVRFYGWYRRTRLGDQQPAYSIDVFCKRMLDDGTEADVSVDTVTYSNDPRRNIKSLEADICALAQRWLGSKVSGDVRTIDQLTQQAKRPVVQIKRLNTIDSLILKMKEVRDTGIRAGGTRYISLEGDVKGGPTVLIELNVTPQAIALKGKPPSLYSGTIYDVVRDGKNIERKAPLARTPSAENVRDLQAKLKEARDNDDVATARKIRSILRKMGHKGGARKVAK